ncbi:MAG: hypothetical protein FWD14_04540 [Treponema sp.]|nr:hypothetical protein [Treponema sp.]
MKNTIIILLLAIICCSCNNKKAENANIVNESISIEDNTLDEIVQSELPNLPSAADKIRNTEILKKIKECNESRVYDEFIISIKGAIKHVNRDTLIVYENNSKESESFLIDYENIFLLPIEETSGWYYFITGKYEADGYIYLYDITEKSFYGDLEKNRTSGNHYIHLLNTEHEIVMQNENIKRYGPLLTISHNGKTINFMDTLDGVRGKKHLLMDYYPEYNELLILEQYYQGNFLLIYNLEFDEYRCERIDAPYFNDSRTYMLSMVYSDSGLFLFYKLKIFKISNGYYEEIHLENVDISSQWSLKGIFWINDNEAHIDYGDAGKIIVEIGDRVKVVNNLPSLVPSMYEY